ncbi:MAG: hypothetical protein ACO3PC_06625 [Steroidobacteraceae bacterium]
MNNARSIAWKAFASLAIPVSLLATLGNHTYLLDWPSAVMVFTPVVIAAICLQIGTGQHWAKTCLVLGVPVGLLGTSIGMVQIVSGISDARAAGPAMSVCLVTLLYGGLLSAIGFAALNTEHQEPRKKAEMIWWIIPFIVTLLVSVWGAVAGETSVFFRDDAFWVTLACIVTFMSFRRATPPITRWAEAALFSSIICVGVGILKWFSNLDYESGEIDVDAINLAVLGVLYGCCLYIGAYFYSFHKEQVESYDAPRMNWHFLEVNAFLYFLLIAPTSIPESLLKAESNARAEQQQKDLSERITALENELRQLKRN